MTTLDSIAYRSVAAMEGAVADVVVPPVSVFTPTPLVLLRRTAGYALAGAAGVVLAVVALLFVATPADEVVDTPSTTLPSTTVVEPTTPTTLPTTVPDVPVVPIVPPETTALTPGAVIDGPTLTIVSPEGGAVVDADRVEVVGIAEPGVVVRAADGTEIPTDDRGLWAHVVALEVGANRLAFSGTNDSDRVAWAYVTVTRPAPPTTTTTKPRPTTTTTEAETWEFTAHNTYGTCAEEPPYDVFYGSGKPGTEITVTSEFGGGSTVVDAEGMWNITVFFPSAPKNTPFTVKVKDFTGAKRIFEFVHTQ